MRAVEARTYDPTTTIRVRPLSVSLTEPNELTAHPRQTQETHRAGRSMASIAHPSPAGASGQACMSCSVSRIQPRKKGLVVRPSRTAPAGDRTGAMAELQGAGEPAQGASDPRQERRGDGAPPP
jgi:hypothetical protein